MNVKFCIRILLATVTVALLPACASNDGAVSRVNNTPPVAPSIEVIVHKVKSGDRLSDIAKQYTGTAENWRSIAAFNEISNPRRLRVGDEIEIPMTLTPGYVDNRASASRTVTPTLTSARVSKRTTSTEADAAAVVIEPVATNRNFELKPLPIDQTQRASAASAYVKIVGSYYPKGVYSQPAPYSTLLLRVAPGTLFEFDRKVNDWYKVITDKGTGYIRVVDGLIIE